jgi:hypothetical protein
MVQFEPRNEEDDSDELTEFKEEVEKLTLLNLNVFATK